MCVCVCVCGLGWGGVGGGVRGSRDDCCLLDNVQNNNPATLPACCFVSASHRQGSVAMVTRRLGCHVFPGVCAAVAVEQRTDQTAAVRAVESKCLVDGAANVRCAILIMLLLEETGNDMEMLCVRCLKGHSTYLH